MPGCVPAHSITSDAALAVETARRRSIFSFYKLAVLEGVERILFHLLAEHLCCFDGLDVAVIFVLDQDNPATLFGFRFPVSSKRYSDSVLSLYG